VARALWALWWNFMFFDLHPCIILQIKPTWCTVLLGIFISRLHMFRAIMCPSSGEITVSMRHWCLSVCTGRPADQSAIHTEWQIPVSHKYSSFSWWWAHSCSKHVEKRNKYTQKNRAPLWLYLQDCGENLVPISVRYRVEWSSGYWIMDWWWLKM
jgi:hypothetical protein